MSTDSHLFLDALEQMREILMSPDVSSRAQAAGMSEVIKDLFELMDQYAVAQYDLEGQPKDSDTLKSILDRLAANINVLETHNLLSLKRLSFLSDVSPKT